MPSHTKILLGGTGALGKGGGGATIAMIFTYKSKYFFSSFLRRSQRRRRYSNSVGLNTGTGMETEEGMAGEGDDEEEWGDMD